MTGSAEVSKGPQRPPEGFLALAPVLACVACGRGRVRTILSICTCTTDTSLADKGNLAPAERGGSGLDV